MNNDEIARVHYFEGQFLRRQDFNADQGYYLDRRRRHNIAHHIWGIVWGLELVLEGDRFFVNPGLAVDGFGRELILAEASPIADSNNFTSRDSNRLDVWLTYSRTASDDAPQGYGACGENGDEAFYRWRESPTLRLTVSDEGIVDRRMPEDVDEEGQDFGPHQPPPDEPLRYWPVFLGQIEYDMEADELGGPHMAGRPYAGLRGEKICAPSGSAYVQIGDGENDERLFGVFLPDTDPDTDDEAILEVLGAADIPVDGEKNLGQINIRADTTLYGDLKIDDGAINFGAGIARSKDQPWHIYHHGDQNEHELRIEMAGGANGANRVAIGFWSSEDEAFKPCLTITDNCVTTVHGNLVVEGQIEYGSEAPPQLNPEADQFVKSSFMTGIGGISRGGLGHMLLGLMQPSLTQPGLAQPGMAATNAEMAISFVNQMESNPELVQAFKEQIAASPSLSTLIAGDSPLGDGPPGDTPPVDSGEGGGA